MYNNVYKCQYNKVYHDEGGFSFSIVKNLITCWWVLVLHEVRLRCNDFVKGNIHMFNLIIYTIHAYAYTHNVYMYI